MSISEGGIKFIVGASIALVGAGIFKWIKKGNEPIETTYETVSVAWKHTLEVLRKERIKDGGWTVPKNAVVIDTKWAYKGMKEVPDGVDENGEIKYTEEPEYATWYYYEADDYVQDRVMETSGSCNHIGDTMTCPHDPNPTLEENMKLGRRTVSYTGTFRNALTGEMKTFELDREVWDTVRPGTRVKITTTRWNPDKIKSINII